MKHGESISHDVFERLVSTGLVHHTEIPRKDPQPELWGGRREEAEGEEEEVEEGRRIAR